jgi:uncharacterized protein YjiS (DUF1127 family)
MSMLDEAPVCAATGREGLLSNFGLSTLTNRLTAMISAWRSRRVVMDMREFDDAQLADIGLQRHDVNTALELPFTVDPSHHLISARQNPLRGTRRF